MRPGYKLKIRTSQFIQPHTSPPDDDFEQSDPVFTRNILVQFLSN